MGSIKYKKANFNDLRTHQLANCWMDRASVKHKVTKKYQNYTFSYNTVMHQSSTVVPVFLVCKYKCNSLHSQSAVQLAISILSSGGCYLQCGACWLITPYHQYVSMLSAILPPPSADGSGKMPE